MPQRPATSFAAITYLCTLVPTFTEGMKCAAAVGAGADGVGNQGTAR